MRPQLSQGYCNTEWRVAISPLLTSLSASAINVRRGVEVKRRSRLLDWHSARALGSFGEYWVTRSSARSDRAFSCARMQASLSRGECARAFDAFRKLYSTGASAGRLMVPLVGPTRKAGRGFSYRGRPRMSEALREISLSAGSASHPSRESRLPSAWRASVDRIVP